MILDGEIIVLQAKQHSQVADSCICQVLLLDLLKGLVVTVDSKCTAKNICVEPFYTKDTGEQFMFLSASFINNGSQGLSVLLITVGRYLRSLQNM